MTGRCVYCGAGGGTADHVPSKVLLDEPYPPDLPVVPACTACNNAFSLDEQYVACFVDCVVSGSTEPSAVAREKVRRIFTETPALRARVEASRRSASPQQAIWEPEVGRVANVVLKLARGHAAFEMGEPHLHEPDALFCVPLESLSQAQAADFLSPWTAGSTLWPEVGSRAFVQAARGGDIQEWQVLQPGRYRYLVLSRREGLLVQLLLSEYLACRVLWE